MLRIRLSEPTLVHDLVDFLQRADCVALQAGQDVIEIHVPRARTPEQARRDAVDLLAAWRAMHPGVEAQIPD